MACIFPANREDGVMALILKGRGISSNFSSVVNSRGGLVSTSIFIFTL
jgi:hypothetical protein